MHHNMYLPGQSPSQGLLSTGLPTLVLVPPQLTSDRQGPNWSGPTENFVTLIEPEHSLCTVALSDCSSVNMTPELCKTCPSLQSE